MLVDTYLVSKFIQFIKRVICILFEKKLIKLIQYVKLLLLQYQRIDSIKYDYKTNKNSLNSKEGTFQIRRSYKQLIISIQPTTNLACHFLGPNG